MKHIIKQKNYLLILLLTIFCAFSFISLTGLADGLSSSTAPSTNSENSTTSSRSDVTTPQTFFLPADSGTIGGCNWSYDGNGVFEITPGVDNALPNSYTTLPWRTTYKNEVTTFKFTDTSPTNDGFVVGSSMNSYFSDMESLMEIEGFNLIDTSAVTDASSLFQQSFNLQKIDMSGMDFSNTTSMFSMFFGCSFIKTIDLTGIKTPHVTIMDNMFYQCVSLTEIKGIETLDTQSVTSTQSMFYYTNNLGSLDLSQWNTHSLSNMSSMFTTPATLPMFTTGITHLSLFSLYNSVTMTNAFRNTPLIELTIGDGFVFENDCQLGDENLPEGYSSEWRHIKNNIPASDIYADSTTFMSTYNAETDPTKTEGRYIRMGVEYTILLEGNGGIATDGSTSETILTRYKVDPDDGVNLVPLTNPYQYAGFELESWNNQADGQGTSYLEGEDVSNLTKIANSTVPLYAQWKTVAILVTFDVNGGTSENLTAHILYMDLIAEPSEIPLRRAFQFTGWYKEPTCVTLWNFQTDTMTNTPLTLYAGWVRTDWEVFFDANGGATNTLPEESLLVPINTALDIRAYQPGAAAAPNNRKNALLGWRDQNGSIVKNDGQIMVNDLYLTANWTPLSDLITRQKENLVTYKNESTAAEIEAAIGAKAEYTDYLGYFHDYPVFLDWNPVWLVEGGVNEIKLYLEDPADEEKVYGTVSSYLYVLNRSYIDGPTEMWIFEGEALNPDNYFATGYGESPNFEEKRIDRGPLNLTFDASAVNIWDAGTYWAFYSVGFQDYDLKTITLSFPVIVHVQKRVGLTHEETQQVNSSDFWVKVTEIYHTMEKGQIIDVTPSNYMDGGSLRKETVPSDAGYDRQLNVDVGNYIYMSPDIVNVLQEEKTGQMNMLLNGRSWIFDSAATEAVGNNYLKGYYDLRMDLTKKEAVTNLVGAETPQMQLGFAMNRPWFGTPTFVITPNDSIKSSVASGATPYLFRYNENTNELELVGSMTVRSDGALEIPMNGVYKDYVIVTSLPSTGNYRITENTNALDSKTYEAIANNQIDSGHALPSGNGLNGISTTKYAQVATEAMIAEKSSSKNPLFTAVLSIAGIALLSRGYLLWKKRKEFGD